MAVVAREVGALARSPRGAADAGKSRPSSTGTVSTGVSAGVAGEPANAGAGVRVSSARVGAASGEMVGGVPGRFIEDTVLVLVLVAGAGKGMDNVLLVSSSPCGIWVGSPSSW